MQPQNSKASHNQSHSPRWQFSYFGGTPEYESSGDWGGEQGEHGFPLSQAHPGQRVQLLKIRNVKVKRLLKRELVSGDILTVLSVQSSGSVIVVVGNKQMGLGAGIAQDLIVVEIARS